MFIIWVSGMSGHVSWMMHINDSWMIITKSGP